MDSENYFDGVATKWNSMRSEYFKEEIREIILSKLDIRGCTFI